LLTADFNEPSAFTNLQSQKARPCDIVRQRNRMASIGHIAVGMATTRIRRDDAAPRWTSMAWWSMLALLLREATLGMVLRERTEYGRGFSEQAFRQITIGQSDAAVRDMVGSPLGEWWDYFNGEEPTVQQIGCSWVYLEADRVAVDTRAVGPVTAMCSQRGIHAGMARSELQRPLGRPQNVCWRYSRGPAHGFHRARVVCFADRKVVAVLRRWQRG
jgi:hypothetical protein